jgi:hypothetical protein
MKTNGQILSKGGGSVVPSRHVGCPVGNDMFFLVAMHEIFKHGDSVLLRQGLHQNNALRREAIRWPKAKGAASLNARWTELKNRELLCFNRDGGGIATHPAYRCCALRQKTSIAGRPKAGPFTLIEFFRVPNSRLRAIGNLAYRHIE